MPEPAAAPRAQLAYLERTSSFHRARLAGRTAAVRSAADLPRLPLTTKAELRADQAANSAIGGAGFAIAGVTAPGTAPVAEHKTRTVYRTARGDGLPPELDIDPAHATRSPTP